MRTVHFTILFLTICLTPVVLPAAEDAVDVELKALAAQIRSLIEKKEGGRVAVGEFKGATRLKVSNGAELQVKLAEFLKSEGLSLDSDNYRFEVTGTFIDFEDPKSKILTVKIVARVTDSSAEELGSFNRFIFGAESVPRLLGLNVSTSPNANAKDRSDAFKDALKNPGGSVDGTKIRADAKQPYAIEVMTPEGPDYIPRAPAKDSRGRLLVELKKGDVFAIRLHNDSPHDAAVSLTLDGINSFHFSEVDSTSQKKAEFWIVPANSAADVYGWHKNSKKSTEFKVVDFPESVAAGLNIQPSATIGTITASFSAAWTDDDNKPRDETTSRAAGEGNEIGVDTKQVQRFIGQVRSTITVRFEP